MLTEEEATYLAIVFEETGAHQYKKNREMERQSGGEGGNSSGLKSGFEEDFDFGEEDENDYWDKEITD